MTKDIEICPIESTLKVINRKWTVVLIRDMFLGKKHFLEFKQNKNNLSNTVLSDTLKHMENNGLIKKEISSKGNKNLTEYHLTDKGFKLNKILYGMAVFGLDELECGEDGDEEIIALFKEHYAKILEVH